MAKSTASSELPGNRLSCWSLEHRMEQVQGPDTSEGRSGRQPWYFSTSGYDPAIAAAPAKAPPSKPRGEGAARGQPHPRRQPALFLEVDAEDASEFTDVLEVRGVEIGGHKVLSSVVPNAIAALLLHLRDTKGVNLYCHFGWTKGNPIGYLFGEGDTAPAAHEMLTEPEPSRRPPIHVGGR